MSLTLHATVFVHGCYNMIFVCVTVCMCVCIFNIAQFECPLGWGGEGVLAPWSLRKKILTKSNKIDQCHCKTQDLTMGLPKETEFTLSFLIQSNYVRKPWQFSKVLAPGVPFGN